MDSISKECLDKALKGLKNGNYKLVKDTYFTTGNVYLEIGDFKNDELVNVITVNVLPLGSDEYICVDTNNCTYATTLLEKLKIAEDTGYTNSSGYCVYPIYKLNNDELEKYLVKEAA